MQVYGLSLETNSTHRIVDMVTNLPPRDTKKGPKLYDIATPLLHAEVCATATNSGVAILRAAFKPTLAVCGLPHIASFEPADAGHSDDLLALGAAGDDGEDAAADGTRKDCAASVVMVVGGKLMGATFTTPDPELMEGGASDAERAALGRGIPAKLQAPGHVPPLDVAVSHRFALCRPCCHSWHLCAPMAAPRMRARARGPRGNSTWVSQTGIPHGLPHGGSVLSGPAVQAHDRRPGDDRSASAGAGDLQRVRATGGRVFGAHRRVCSVCAAAARRARRWSVAALRRRPRGVGGLALGGRRRCAPRRRRRPH